MIVVVAFFLVAPALIVGAIVTADVNGWAGLGLLAASLMTMMVCIVVMGSERDG